MMKRADLERLCTVADAAFHKETAILRRIQVAEAALAAEARNLRRTVPTQDLPIGVQSAAGEPWRRWREEKLMDIERHRATLMVDRDEALTRARHAFGRYQVLTELTHKPSRR